MPWHTQSMRAPPLKYSPTYDLTPTIDPLRVSLTFLSEIVDNADRSVVSRLTDDGIIPIYEGKYPIVEAVGAYIRWITSNPETAGVKYEISQEKLRSMQIDNDVRLGVLAPLDEAQAAFSEAMQTLKNNIDGIPPRCANEFAGIADAAIIRQRLDEELTSALDAAQRRLDDLYNRETGRGVSKAEAAAISRRVGKRTKGVATKRRRAGKMEK